MPTDGCEDIRVLRSVANRLVEVTSKLPTVIKPSIPGEFDGFLQQTKEQRE